jgi:hypothetical protein
MKRGRKENKGQEHKTEQQAGVKNVKKEKGDEEDRQEEGKEALPPTPPKQERKKPVAKRKKRGAVASQEKKVTTKVQETPPKQEKKKRLAKRTKKEDKQVTVSQDKNKSKIPSTKEPDQTEKEKEEKNKEKVEEDEVDEEDIGEKDDILEHLKWAKAQAEEARENFLNNTTLFKWQSPITNRWFYIRAKNWNDWRQGFDDVDDLEYSWPRMFGGRESQPVLAAAWAMPGSILTVTWTYSPSCYETGLFFSGFIDDVLELMDQLDEGSGKIIPQGCENCAPSFSCSTGEDLAARFYCPPLETLKFD